MTALLKLCSAHKEVNNMTTSAIHNPFVGLRPYQSSDSMFYFGRSEQVKTIMRLLHQNHFVTIIGSSGAGKSSLIRAGLIPQLEAGFLVNERDRWKIVETKPGDAPLSNLIVDIFDMLEINLGVHNTERKIKEVYDHGPQTFLKTIDSVLTSEDSNLFILVDQFEELFRFGLKKDQAKFHEEAELFVSLLISLSRFERHIYICLTMRSDFLGECDSFYGLPETINKSQFLVPRLTRSQRQEVIINPVNLSGTKITSRLVDRLLNEKMDTRDDLPVLQHVLMRTWDAWKEDGEINELDILHYEKTHTIHQSLNRHADEALAELSTEEKQIAKVLFQSLTAIDTSNRRVRRPVHLDVVCAIANASEEQVMDVINCFCDQKRSFLILSQSQKNPLIDIAHESLIRQWDTLDEWVEEESEAEKIFLRLVETCNLHNKGKASLYEGKELAEVKKWFLKFPNEHAWIAWSKKYHRDYKESFSFLKNSIRKYDADKANKEQELERRVKLLSESSISMRRKQALSSAVVMILAVLLMGLSFTYLTERNTKAELLRKYELQTGDLILSLPIFSDEVITTKADEEHLLRQLSSFNFSTSMADRGTQDEYFAYLQTGSEKIWYSIFPLDTFRLKDSNSLIPKQLLEKVNLLETSKLNSIKVSDISIDGALVELKYFTYSKIFKVENGDIVRLTLVESSKKYKNHLRNTNLTIVVLFLVVLFLIIIINIISNQLLKKPLKDFEKEMKSIINQSKDST